MATPFLFKTPAAVPLLYPRRLWKIKGNSNSVYLTFDDGPTPEITAYVLDQLKTFDARATFFCIGKNIAANPDIFQNILDEGHSIGNHTWNHYNARNTPLKTYMEDTLKTKALIHELDGERNNTLHNIFRPPYGRTTPSVARKLHQNGFQLVMWDILSGDYDPRLQKEKSLNAIKRYTKPGSILIFHDSLKASSNLKYLLPRTLEHLSEKGYELRGI